MLTKRSVVIVGNIIVDLILTVTYVGLAATVGHRPDPLLPIDPPYYGTEYFSWAFPLTPDIDRYGVDAVARHVLLGDGTPDPARISANVVANLKYNLPAYLLIPPILLLAANGVVRALKKTPD
jgi:hypothetical protein